MNYQNIKIIQYLLEKENRHNIALKLQNSYYEDYIIDSWNNESSGEVNIFVHPDNYLEFLELSENDKNILLKILNGLPHKYSEINSIKFTINTDIEIEKINDVVYIFVDEAGDMDFSTKGSKYYMFNFLVKKRPFKLHEYIANYRYKLLERNLDPLNSHRLNIEYFHAHNDNKHIKRELFNIISTFDKKAIKIYSYILEKPKVSPTKREEKDKFYIDNLNYFIKKLLDKLKIDTNFIIITDRLPVKKNKNEQIKALKKGIKSYILTNKLNIRYDIFHHCSASSSNLQIIDYISWAIFRKHERNEDSYYKIIEKYILDEDIMTKNRVKNHYQV